MPDPVYKVVDIVGTSEQSISKAIENAIAKASAPPVFLCRASSDTPLPETMPVIVWRIGLDLSPVDVNDDDQVAWLESLVWPEEVDRLATSVLLWRLRKNIDRSSSVVFRFRDSLRAISATWISNEAPQVVSDIVDEPPLPHPSGSFLMTVDGQPKAWADPHGRSIQWIG